MRIKITSNGKRAGSKIIDLDSGVDLTSRVMSCELLIDHEGVKAQLTILVSEVDIEADVRRVSELRYEPMESR